MDRREWEFKMKRDLIAESAVKMFTENAFDNVTLTDIAENAGYSKSSIYSYFKSKDDIIIHLIDMAEEEFVEIEQKIDKLIESVSTDKIFDVIFDESILKAYRAKKVAMLFQKNMGLINMNKSVILDKITRIYEKRISWVGSLLNKFLPENSGMENRLYSYLIMGAMHGMEHYAIVEDNMLPEKERYEIMKKFICKAMNSNKSEEER